MRSFFQKTLLALLAVIVLTCSSCIQSPEDRSEEATFRDLTWAIGTTMPRAEDFVSFLPDGCKVAFAKQYEISSTGTYTIEFRVTDEKGNEKHYEAKLTLIKDTQPPEIRGVKDLQAYIGDGIAYRAGITCADNCDSEVKLEVDSSAVNLQREGAYEVTYIATDGAGNRTETKATLYLYQEKITKDQLFALLDPVIQSRIPTAGSLEMQARAIYNYVNLHVAYTSSSDKSDWVRAAYDGLVKGEGDCYTYFALSKAFFERLGMENMDIQRTPGIVDERHYWNLVNIGTKESPRWYHFDACRLLGAQHVGCLLTDTQVDAYTRIRVNDLGETGYFYAYDKTAYPASAKEIITSTPSLEPYY